MSGTFGIGSAIVPAHDGMLERLGYDVGGLGSRALGVVIETRPSKSLVHFPDLNLSLWLAHDEIADIEAKAAAGDAAFKKLLPNIDAPAPDLPIAWWVWMLSRCLPVTHVLGLESGALIDIWAEDPAALGAYFEGAPETRSTYVGLGIGELKLADWHHAEKILGERLLFARFLPAGMHKLEIAMYLRASN